MADGAAARGRISVLGLAFIPVLFHLAIVATSGIGLAFVPRFGTLFKLGFVTASALTHWSIYTVLLVTFAATLRPGHDPLISAMARRMHPMTDELTRYTRRVTIAWTGFFAVQLVTSILLFCLAPLVVWSFFVNILDFPLVAAMFAAEYAVRLRCLRDPPRHSLAAIVKMVAEIRKPQPAPAPP
jgi:hypothetical protein